ncbi:MAG: sodium/proton-translocating pyrophosphatase, partial [candidate division WOR-3 bacterium]
MNDNLLLLLPFFGSLLSLVFAFIFYRNMQLHPKGDEKMEEIASIVRKGAFAYLKEQYRSVGIFFIFVFIILFIVSYFLKLQSLWTPFAFLTGGFFSGLAGFIGMNTATQASSRTAQAAKKSLDEALKVAFRAGAVMGLTVVGLGLLDITVWFFILRLFYQNDLYIITATILTFGMGA